MFVSKQVRYIFLLFHMVSDTLRSATLPMALLSHIARVVTAERSTQIGVGMGVGAGSVLRLLVLTEHGVQQEERMQDQ